MVRWLICVFLWIVPPLQKGVTDRRTDRQTDGHMDWTIHRAAWSQLKQGKSEGFDSCDRPSNLTQIGFKSLIFCVTLKFDGWAQKIIRYDFYTTSSFVYHFKSISEFKLELQSGNTQSGSNSVIFFSRVTLQFEVWPWKTIGHLFNATLSFVHHFVAIG